MVSVSRSRLRMAALLTWLVGCRLARGAEEFPQIRLITVSGVDAFLLNKGSRILGEYNARVGYWKRLHIAGPGGRDFGDVDGDGRLDEVNANGVFLGHGDGQFGFQACMFVGYHSARIACGDLNGDGRADVIVGGRRVYLGNPDGTLKFAGEIGIASMDWGRDPDFKLVDLDADGDLDLIGPCVAWNKGQLMFEVDQHQISYWRRLIVCDLNRDGLKDLVTIGEDWRAGPYEWEWPNAVFVWLGAGRERLGDVFVIRVPPTGDEFLYPAPGVAVGDLDRDGSDDILSGGPLGSFAFFRGRGDGTFDEPKLLPNPRQVWPTALLLEDLDRDGNVDLLVGSPAGLDIYWGTSEGYLDFSNPVVLRGWSSQDWPARMEAVGPIHRPFIRGDADDSGTVSVADAWAIAQQVFALREVVCGDASDADDSGRVELMDAVYLLRHFFAGGPPPPYPYPEWGGDPTKDRSEGSPGDITGDLGCSIETFRYSDGFSTCPSDSSSGSSCKPVRQFLVP